VPTDRQKRRERADRLTRWVGVASVLIALLSVLVNVWIGHNSVVHDRSANTSVDTKIGTIGERLGKIETAVRLLAAATAPQMQKAIDDSLAVAVSSGIRADVNSSLFRVAAAAATLKNGKVPANADQSRSWAKAAAEVTKTHSELPGAWSAAAALIDYDSMARLSFITPDQGPCLSTNVAKYEPHPKDFSTRRNVIALGHCTLVIDDRAAFEKSVFGRNFRSEQAAGVTDIFAFYLDHVHLVYRGMPLIPFSSLDCIDCTFSVETSAPPPAEGKEVVRDMLLAEQGNLTLQSARISGGL
jgi:hypothetical protein